MADKPFIARGFHSRRAPAPPGRLPPGWLRVDASGISLLMIPESGSIS
jgi:hypothetical protein